MTGYMLTDPGSSLSVQRKLEIFGGKTWTEPSEVRELKDGQRLGFEGALGIRFVVSHAPGHTGGSVTFRLPTSRIPTSVGRPFTGDLLFAGSIGRTDLPGGLARDLRIVARSRSRCGRHIVLPGHGPQTTIGRERASNPFLRGLRDAGSARPGL